LNCHNLYLFSAVTSLSQHGEYTNDIPGSQISGALLLFSFYIFIIKYFRMQYNALELRGKGQYIKNQLLAGGEYTFILYRPLNDRDGDFIPDEVEDAVEDVKVVAKEVKRRAKNVKNELKDVVEAAKELGNQMGDVGSAVKGKKRQGRKKR